MIETLGGGCGLHTRHQPRNNRDRDGIHDWCVQASLSARPQHGRRWDGPRGTNRA